MIVAYNLLLTEILVDGSRKRFHHGSTGMSEYDHKDMVRLAAQWLDSGVPTDPPPGETLTVTDPQNTQTVVALTNDGTGLRHGDLDLSSAGIGEAPGVWKYVFEGSGESRSGAFRVRRSQFA